ncbi:segmentation protein cap'n'collar isoform X2 [Ischnura elegans]|uniref:segmentation protein cap'n'collar isoform X2 n=1 Tax=Ischnura elegans TaxID=197161 RepID=UPI001ED8A5C4|nr:segmentation protein cap'n'collar isoform X2 [Ischnura elegans]
MIFPNPKKIRGEDVFHLVLALSLLGAQHPFQGVMYAGTLKDPAVHSSLLIGAYQSEVFHDLIALGRYSRSNSPWSRNCWDPRSDYSRTTTPGGRGVSSWPSEVEDLSSNRGMYHNGRNSPMSEYGCDNYDSPHEYALGGSVTAYLLDVETSVNSEDAGEGEGGGEATGGGAEALKVEEEPLEDLQFGPPAREEEVEDEGFDSSPLIKVEEELEEEVVVKEESDDEAVGWDLAGPHWVVDDPSERLVDWGDVILKTEIEDEEEAVPSFGMNLSIDEEDHSYLPEDDVLSPDMYAASPSSELSREDMDLIEVLWKQDVDLGVPFDIFNPNRLEEGVGSTSPLARQSDQDDEDEIEKLKALAEKLHDCPKIDEDSAEDFLGPWAGLPYTVDLETGEYVFQEDASSAPEGSSVGEEPSSSSPASEQPAPLLVDASAEEDLGAAAEEEEAAEEGVEGVVAGLSLSGFSLEDALQFVGIDEDEDDVEAKAAVSPEQVEGRSSDAKAALEGDEDSGDLSDVISEEADMQASHYGLHQVAHQHPHHHLYHSYHRGPVPQQHQQQGRAPLVRAVSMEQRWQDLANLLSLPPQGGGVSVEGGCIPPHLQRLPGPQQQQQHHRSHHYGAQPHAPLPSSLLHHGFKEEGNMVPMNGVLINNATLAPPQGEIETGPSPYPSLLGGTPSACSAASDLGSALATSMSLNGAGGDNVSGMGNNLDAMGCFKAEPCAMPPTGPTPPHHMQHHHHHLPPNHHIHNHSSPDFLFYQNSSSSGASSPSGGAPVTPTFPPPELHHGACSGAAPSADGLLSSILNDEELQFMDMAVNEGMYTMRMLEGATGGAGAGGGIGRGSISSSSSTGGPVDESSDSAVSSMGSDGGEWAEVTSGRGHQHYPVTPLGQSECHGGGKFRSYEFGFTPSVLPGGPHGLSGGDMHSRRGSRHDPSHLGAGLSDGPPVAQKKHHMFARRYFQEQGPQPSSPESGISGGPPMRSNSPAGGALAPQSSGKYAFGETAGAASPDFPSGGAGALNSPSHPGLRHARAPNHGDPGHGPRPMHSDSTGLIPGLRDGTTMHNHSYSLPPEGASAPRGPPARDKMSSPRHRSLEVLASEREMVPLHHMDHSPAESTHSCVEEVTPRRRHTQHHHSHMSQHQLTRDEKRARALGVPICVSDIINLPMDEFNERLSKHDLTEAQLGLIRDIRRRGKNKVAAQNCRKRKLDQILSLADEVRRMRDRKEKLVRDRETMLEQHRLAKEKFSRLYRHVFQALRDPEGRPYSQFEYSLQQSADGTVLLVPRAGGPPPDSQGGHGHGDAPGTSGSGTPGRSGV